MGKKQVTLVFILCAGACLLFPYADSDDDISHWVIARAALQRPALFLHLWGRPGFTIPHALPAQLGFIGCRIFSILLTLGTGLLVARIVGKNRRLGALAIGVTVFQTAAFSLADGALTETVHAFALALALLALKHQRFWWCALALSWAAISRFEGMAFLPFWAIALTIVERRSGCPWKHILVTTFLLGVLPLLWNLACFASTGFQKPLAIFTENVFINAPRAYYGSGAWWKFLVGSVEIHGWLIVPLMVLGLVVAARVGSKHASLPSWIPLRSRSRTGEIDRWVIASYVLGFYAVQSILWALGLFRTGGYFRFFVSITPAAALLAVDGFRLLVVSLRASRVTSPWLRRGRIAGGVIIGSAIFSLFACLPDDFVDHQRSDAIRRCVEEVARRGGASEATPLVTSARAPFLFLDNLDLWDLTTLLPLKPAGLARAPAGALVLFAGYPPAPGQEFPITSFYDEAEVAALRSAAGSKNWVHRLRKTRPEFEELLDTSPPDSDPENTPYPYFVKLFRLTQKFEASSTDDPLFDSPYLWAR